MKKRIMILGASVLQLPGIEKAKEMGYEVIAVDMDPYAIGFKTADICLVISTIDIPAVVQAAKEYHIDGVMTLASDMPMRTVAAVAKECGLVGIDMETAIKATNKAEMREALAAGNVPIPEFHRVRTEDAYREAIAFFEEKCIVKPADNSGSRGVYLINNVRDEKQVAEAYAHSKQYSRSGEIVVEEYMEGPEVSVETMSVDGVCHVVQITDKLTTGAPYFVEMGHNQPSMLSEEVKEDIRRVAIAANRAIGIQNGPSHTEIKVTKQGAKIVELGARLGGDCITTHLVPLSTGVNMVEMCIRIAMGEKPEIKPAFDKGSAIRYFRHGAGKVVRLDGVDEAEKMPGIQQVSIVHGLGEDVHEITSSSERMGFVVAQGVDPQDAIDRCEAALEKINIVLE
ncbi:MAG: ATP-grasp domain-containing protein [Aristaeellaceae bacterium]